MAASIVAYSDLALPKTELPLLKIGCEVLILASEDLWKSILLSEWPSFL